MAARAGHGGGYGQTGALDGLLQGFASGSSMPSQMIETGQLTLQDARQAIVKFHDLEDTYKAVGVQVSGMATEIGTKLPAVAANVEATSKDARHTAAVAARWATPVALLTVTALVLAIAALIAHLWSTLMPAWRGLGIGGGSGGYRPPLFGSAFDHSPGGFGLPTRAGR